MRRPLCLFGLAFVAALLVGILVIPHRAVTCGGLDEETVFAAGRVGWKEHRISGTEEILVVTLEDVLVVKPDKAAALTQIISNSDAIRPNHISADSVKRKKAEDYMKQNRERLLQEGAEEIEGLLCYPEGDEDPPMGSIVLVEGKFRSFSHATNPGEFDAADYYRMNGKQGRLMRCRCIAKSPGFWPFREKLYRLKEYFALLINASYPEKEAAVMRAMLLGEKAVLPADVKSLYQQNGIIHILAISGLHLSILGMGFYNMLKKLRMPAPVNIALSVGLMCCYGTMTGMGISIVRALVMFSLKLCAGMLGRTYDMMTAMTAAALLLLIQQPLYLMNSGFLFSFGAICGIGLLPDISKHLPESSREGFSPYSPRGVRAAKQQYTLRTPAHKNKLVKAFFTGLWVSLSTLPVYLCFYYEFPPYSVLLNLIVIPCMGAVLAGGIFTVMAAALFLPLGKAAAIPSVLFLAFYEKCCNLCLSLPGSSWITGCPAAWQVVFYLLIFVGLAVLGERIKRRQFFGILFGAVLLLTVRVPRGFEITMLDIGQGDCIYLSDGSGAHYLIDGGSSDKKDVETYQIVPFLKYRGVGRLNGVFVTHPDGDHISGIEGLLDHYKETGIKIGCLFLPEVAAESRNESYHRLEELAEKAGVAVRYLHAGERMKSRKVMLTCLHPQKEYVCEDANAYSTTLYLHYGDFSALLTGDLQGEGEELVTQRYRALVKSGKVPEGGVTLLKVAHHGSKNSTEETFLELVNPRIALISAGRDNSYGHPHRETMERLAGQECRIYQTPVSGAVTVRVRDGNVWVEEYIE